MKLHDIQQALYALGVYKKIEEAKTNIRSSVSQVVSGVANFLQLTDTPNTYQGQAGKLLAINEEETAIIYKTESIQSVNDKTGIITLSTEDVEDTIDKRYITDQQQENINSMPKITYSSTEPENPTTGDIWIIQ